MQLKPIFYGRNRNHISYRHRSWQVQKSAATEELVSECASRVHNTLMRQSIEPGTKEAFLAYVACLHQLYLFGIAVQLKRLGYHMTRI